MGKSSKYLKDNNITGPCYYLNLSNKQVIRGIIDIPRPYNKLQPIGICLTDKNNISYEFGNSVYNRQ